MCYNTSVSSRTSLQFEDILVKHPHIQHLTADYRADGSESLAGAKAQNMSWIFFFFTQQHLIEEQLLQARASSLQPFTQHVC